jgi:hypothetical protein
MLDIAVAANTQTLFRTAAAQLNEWLQAPR